MRERRLNVVSTFLRAYIFGMAESWFWMAGSPRSEWEAEVAAGLSAEASGWVAHDLRPEHIQLWQHLFVDGRPWLLAHADLVVDGAISRTLRVDLDEQGFRGGWSPATLNWDADVPAREAGVDLSPPWGIDSPLGERSAAELGRSAGRWMASLIDRWRSTG